MDGGKYWDIVFDGNSPVVATAIHHGHQVRADILDILNIGENQRLREEDPYTGLWTSICDNNITVFQSRFELDLNRPRDKAIYIHPENAWGLSLWKTPLSPELIEESLKHYDAFYSELAGLLKKLERQFKHFCVLDLHSYNFHRSSPDSADDPALNPEVNIGTGSLTHKKWRPLVDRFINDLSRHDFLGRHLDVRENIKFFGGRLSQWVHQNFPESGCCLAIEFRKFFMDEWTGEPYHDQINAIKKTLSSSLKGLKEELSKL